MSFESRFNRERSNRDVLPREVLVESARILQSKRLDWSAFADVHSAEKIARDKQYVQEREAEWASRQQRESELEAKQLATVFEAVIHNGVDKGGWFGDNSRTLPINVFDDYHNGIDALVERQSDTQGFSHLALGIDVTYSDVEVAKKIARTTGKLRRGELTQVDYFHSAAMGITGKLADVPHVVVGMERANVLTLAKSLPKNQSMLLKRDTAQFVVLEEIKMQLGGFIKYLEQLSMRHVDPAKKRVMIERYQRALFSIQDVLSAKAGLREELFINAKDYKKVLEEDAVYRAIQDAVSGM